jgi:putative transposase
VEKEFEMPRRARLAIANVTWHIIQRGNNRSACFFSEGDYLFYLHLLQQQSVKHGCVIHAYCLMTNHVHLLLTPQEASAPSFMMKHLGQCYVQYINRTYQRSGTLWEGRFKSCLAQNESYALHCYRYIELNPVRAHMTSHPGDYRWSSYRYNGGGLDNDLVTPHSSYLSLGDNAPQRQKAYQSMVESGVGEELAKSIRSATNGNFVLGNERFSREIERALNRRVSPGRAGRPTRVQK